MSDSSKPVRPPCLKCGSCNVAWIQWGKPIWSEKLKGQLERNEVVLGSCFLTEKGEVWECNECGHRFGSHSIRPLLMKHKGEDIPMYMEAQKEAYLYSEKVRVSRLCGCYHCLNTFTRWDIKEWVEDIYVHAVPLCPFCQQDSVIGDAHGYPITEELLKEIRNYCYEEDEWWGE